MKWDSLDIRYIQIFILSILLSYGAFTFDFSFLWQQMTLTFVSGLFTQYFWIKKFNLSYRSFLSTLITCLGIALLLRSNTLWIHPLVVFLSISSKFFISYKKQHFFNPSAFGLVMALFLFQNAWISPGQWGSQISLALWVTALGCFIVNQVHRLNTPWFFLLFFLGGLWIRNFYLGYEIEILFHSATNGSLLIFAFFMISDPKTSPNHFVGQIIFTFFVALMSLILQYYFYVVNGFVYSLIGLAWMVPILNRLFKAQSFQWRKKKESNYFTNLILGNVTQEGK